jgi:hypothetical protein
MEGSGPLHSQGKSPWYPLDSNLGGPQNQFGSGGENKISHFLPGLEPIIQPVAQRYYHWDSFNWAPRHEGVLGEWRYISTHCLTSALDGGEWSASRPGRFNPRSRAHRTHWIGGCVAIYIYSNKLFICKINYIFRKWCWAISHHNLYTFWSDWENLAKFSVCNVDHHSNSANHCIIKYGTRWASICTVLVLTYQMRRIILKCIINIQNVRLWIGLK